MAGGRPGHPSLRREPRPYRIGGLRRCQAQSSGPRHHVLDRKRFESPGPPGRMGRIAEEFSSRLKTNVAVLCPIHYDGLDREQIEDVNRLCGSLARKVLPLLDEQARRRPGTGDFLDD